MIALIDYGAGNLRSVEFALERLGVSWRRAATPAAIGDADAVILPGVGAAGRAMEVLREHGLADVIRKLRQPVLGICLGMQLLFDSSEEDDAQWLGIIPARLEKLPEEPGLRVPHMGWNEIGNVRPDRLTQPLCVVLLG